MASRVGIVTLLVIAAASTFTGLAPSQPSIGTTIYTVQVDPRLCPSPLCGGYWVAIANAARTRCADGLTRPRCYVAIAVDEKRHPLEASLPGEALARADLDTFEFDGVGRLGVIIVAATYGPAGQAPVSGGYYRLVDTGIRCVRAPCFSYRATQVNGSTRTILSDVDLDAAKASGAETARGHAALTTKNGLLARGRFLRSGDGGREFRATRLFLRAPQPRA